MTHEEAGANADAQDELCVARVPLFRGLTYEQQLEVAEVARPTTLTKGEHAYLAGSDISQLMVMHAGRVKVTRLGADGNEQLVRVLEPGDFVGESAFLTGRRPDHAASALEDASMCVFRHADMARLVRLHPSVGLRMLQDVSRRLQDTEARLVSAISEDVSSRLASYLLALPGQSGPDGLAVQLPLAKKDIASLLDTTPESLSRQLRRLQDSGVVVPAEGSRLLVRDVDALMDLSNPV